MALPYKLEYFGTGTGNTAIDISSSVETIDKFTDVGSGEIVSAKLMLDSRFGDFITNTNGDTTPIISQYDLFKLTITDNDNNEYSRFLIQDDISPQKNESGKHLLLELFGRERYLQKMYFPGHFFFISFKDLIIKIRNFYNNNRGSSQPRLALSGTDINTVPVHSYGVFEFGEKTTVYDALMEVVNRLHLPKGEGGGGQYYGLTFPVDSTNNMLLRIRPLGSFPKMIDNIPTLEKPLTLTEVRQPLQGNIIVAKGQEGSGSYPREISIWRSLVEEFDNLPLWDPNLMYEIDSYVRYNNAIYQAINNHSSENILPTVTASWKSIKFVDYVEEWTGDTDFQYSPWTNNKQAVWKNWGGNANGTLATDGYDSLCFPDSNLVIRDKNAWRDWVDFRVATLSDIPTEYLYDATTDANTVQKRTYHGMRVLVDPNVGAIGSTFTGNDKLGNTFENAMVMQDRDGDWIVFRNAESLDECAVLSEGKIWQYNQPNQSGGYNGNRKLKGIAKATSNLAWRDVSDAAAGNDCFHYPAVFKNTDGLIGEDDTSLVTLENGTGGSEFTDDSAIEIEYQYGETDETTDLINILISSFGVIPNILNVDDTLKNFLSDENENKAYQIETYNAGFWATLFEAPFPKSKHNGILENVGELFGGNADNKIPILDLQNLNNTIDGNNGYGYEDSDSLGQLDGIKFLFKFDIAGLDLNTFSGDIPFRVTIYDILGNVWIADKAYRFQGDTQEFDFPFSSFSIYRSRIQVGFKLSNAISRIINPELKITEIFDQRFVKRITLQCMLVYDDDGRFDNWTWESFTRKLVTSFTNGTVKYTGKIDALHFTKTPLAIARDDDTVNTDSVSKRHLMAPIKEYPQISNVVQLQKIANAELDIIKHKNELWTAKYQNRADLNAEQSVYVHDIDFIDDSDSGENNTRKLIIKKITYSIGDRSSSSGLITTVELFRQVAT